MKFNKELGGIIVDLLEGHGVITDPTVIYYINTENVPNTDTFWSHIFHGVSACCLVLDQLASTIRH